MRQANPPSTIREKVEGTSNYKLVPNQYQEFSLALSGNLDPGPDIISLKVDSVDFQAGGDLIRLSLDAIVDVRYQLEGSDDLEQWSPEGNAFDAEFSPQPLARSYTQHKSKRFYRVRVIKPLASN